MPVIPIDDEDIPAVRALRAEFGRFTAATPVAADVTLQHTTNDPAPGVWVHPVDAAPDRALLFLHGGGYGVGSASAYGGLVSQIAARAGVAAFVLDYPVAPDSPLPQALDLAVETLSRICHTHAGVAVAGDSAGGGLALAATARAVREGLEIAAVATFSPWTDLSLSGAGVHEHLPPLLIQVGSDEVLVDDSRRLALAVVNAGGTVRLEVWEGMPHVFQFNVEQLVSARRALDGAAEFLTRHLDDWVDLLR